MVVGNVVCSVFFFKQKTAYEVRISDWSSDVCSSDLRPLSVLAVIVGIAVLREGAETVLFLYGIIVGSSAETLPATFAGGLLGLVLGAAAGALLYLGLLRIPGRYLFSVTGAMVTLLAAGLAAQAVTFVAAAGLIDGIGPVLWDSSWLLSEGSIPGRLLHTLIEIGRAHV